MKEQISVFYDSQIFSLQQYGGISRYFIELARRIAKRGSFTAHVFAPLYINEYLRESSDVPKTGMAVADFKKSEKIRRLTNRILTGAALRLRTPDIVHETYYSATNSFPPSVKRVVTVLDMIHEKFPDSFPFRDNTKQHKAHSVRRADHVLCISENTRRDLIELLGVPEEKTSVVYLGCSLTSVPTLGEHVVQSKPYILYVGNRDGYKNFSGLLRAYATVDSLKNEFNLVCFGGGSLKNREFELIESLGLLPKNIVHMSGTDDLLASLYTSAAVFVFPSQYEGFGIPPLEAMTLGCPVACSNNSSLPEVVGSAAELFDPFDFESIGLAICRVVHNKENAGNLIRLGFDRCKLFSWDKMAEETALVYSKLCSA